MAHDPFNLHALRMHAIETDPQGAIGPDTVFEFTQDGDHAEARYAGGRVASGYLVGTVTENRFEFRYCQRHTDGELAGGHSECTLRRDERGRVQIVEHFNWRDGQQGTNIIAEI